MQYIDLIETLTEFDTTSLQIEAKVEVIYDN